MHPCRTFVYTCTSKRAAIQTADVHYFLSQNNTSFPWFLKKSKMKNLDVLLGIKTSFISLFLFYFSVFIKHIKIAKGSQQKTSNRIFRSWKKRKKKYYKNKRNKNNEKALLSFTASRISFAGNWYRGEKCFHRNSFVSVEFLQITAREGFSSNLSPSFNMDQWGMVRGFGKEHNKIVARLKGEVSV